MSNNIYQTEKPTSGLCKFVVVDGEYRFTNASGFSSAKHNQAVNDGETATAAGIISVFDEYWRMSYSYSTTLELGSGPDDIENITKILGLDILEDW